MIEQALPPATYVDSADDLRALADVLAAEPLLAIDTESNSLYAHRERVCLIQLSTRSADYIIDPILLPDVQVLAPLFANPQIEKVFHAAEYDLMCMKRDFGFTFSSLFDTMIAARICGRKLIGLGALLADVTGVTVDKSHQRDDWGQRPLPDNSLAYAQMDTHYLPLLRDYFIDELARLKRLDEAREAFSEICHVPAARREEFDPEGYWRIALPNNLTRREVALLRELYLLRERIAQQRDLPVFKIFTDKTLITIAQAMPTTLNDLRPIEGMTPSQLRRYGQALLDAVSAGLRAKLPTPPTPEPPADPVVVERYAALREWRKTRALERGVESDVIISKDALWVLAERAPNSLEQMNNVPGLGPWRLEVYGAELLDVIRRSLR
ncbi:MAG TPA: HRDC domain-containing protein [Phototrophicaceae bacterium]|nr:HRDC domain-containing protein [Phototrophicaceae bacterium]